MGRRRILKFKSQKGGWRNPRELPFLSPAEAKSEHTAFASLTWLLRTSYAVPPREPSLRDEPLGAVWNIGSQLAKSSTLRKRVNSRISPSRVAAVPKKRRQEFRKSWAAVWNSGILRAVGCGAVAVAGLLVSGSAYADTNGSGTTMMETSLGVGSVSISTSGNVHVDVIPTSGGSLGVGKDTVTVNSSTGYQLYISGADVGANGYTTLNYNGNPAASSKLAGLAVTTPTAFSSATNNSWGYAVGSEYVSGFAVASVYEAAKNAGNITDSTTIASLKWKGVSKNYDKIRATTNANNKTTDVYFGVYAGTGAMAGNYQNSVVYTAFVEGADKLDISPSNLSNGSTMTVTAEYKSGTLPVTNANQIAISLLDGDTSVGTCNNPTITSNGSSNLLAFTCTVATNGSFQRNKLYDVKVDLTIPGRSDVLSFRAEDSWASYTTMANNANMQDMSAISCKNASTGITYNLKDSRTSKSYRVTKLADGNCWMTQNLWLQGGSTITTANGKSYILPASTNSTSDYKSGVSTAKMNQGTHVDNTVDTTSTNTGSFFNWLAATAGTGNMSGTALNEADPNDSNRANDSVCPQGWKLPTGGSAGQFNALYTNSAYNSYANFKADTAWAVANASTGLQGYCDSSACPRSAGSLGSWWSSTQYGSGSAYNLVANTSYFNPSDSSSYKYSGVSVRCVLSAS